MSARRTRVLTAAMVGFSLAGVLVSCGPKVVDQPSPDYVSVPHPGADAGPAPAEARADDTPSQAEPIEVPSGASELPPPGWFSCHLERSRRCREFGSGCGPDWRAKATMAWLERDCVLEGGRWAEAPCTRVNARTYGGSGPSCGGMLVWFYAPAAKAP